ncbi:hypothetical protein PpBr36_08532 [Pyricularia pennisetigena]|uniref:hypothetical protein n=1 Tax=Pyricularia pennisetigena TaxID=1578925 RepID=UPI001150B547|nr:hypothetical protein PpBr36_08532 [Pyricularia pennisetigena]TLS24339.1 hypothetical protein PpBr36_08532 [Pyricularia pennisetigena]
MKLSTVLSTFALANVSAAAAVDLNMGQEESPIVARSPARTSSRRRAKGGSWGQFPAPRVISDDDDEQKLFEICMESCRRNRLQEGKIKNLIEIDKALGLAGY